MKKIIAVGVSFALVFFILFPLISASAESTGDSDVGFVFNPNTGTITGYTGNPINLVIPSQIDGVSVTHIGENAFEYSSMISLTISNGIYSIGKGAFDNCRSLKYAEIPDSVYSIPDKMFSYCLVLEQVRMSPNITTIGESAFYYCQSLKLIDLPDTIYGISDYAFANSGLLKVTVPRQASMESSAFSGCTNLYDITLNNAIIGSQQFNYCKSLKKVVVPANIKFIFSQAFWHCPLQIVTILGSNTQIYNGAFYECDNVELRIRPDSDAEPFVAQNDIPYKYIESDYEFDDTTGTITEYYGNDINLVVPSTINAVTVNAIDNYAFSNMKNITTVTIPDSVQFIGNWAFQFCSNLTTVTLPSTISYIGTGIFSGTSIADAITIDGGRKLIYVPGDVETYNISSNVKEIGNGAFSYCSYLSYVNIPDTLTSIGDEAFYKCESLTTIDIPANVENFGFGILTGSRVGESIIVHNGELLVYAPFSDTYEVPDGVTTIGDGAFTENYIINTISIPNSVTSIGNSAFYGCVNLRNIVLSDNITSIGSQAFQGCTSLVTMNIPNGITEIAPLTFSGCTGLSNVTFPDTVTTIGNGAFGGCTSYNFKSITIPNSVKSIGDYAFMNCTGLTSITIPNSVTSIGERAFYYCSRLYSVTIPNSTISIGLNAFEGTPWLQNYPNDIVIANGMVICYKGTSSSITIPSTATRICDYAFYGCESLNNIIIPSSVTSIGDLAFAGCISLTSISIPSNVTTIGDGILLATSISSPVIIQNGKTLIYVPISRTSYTIPSGVITIGGMTFYMNESLTSVSIPNTVTNIDNDAFNGCISLSSITIPSSVNIIGSGAFYGCISLSSVTIPNGITTIDDYTFSYCENLTSVSIPNSIINIGEGAFWYCTSLKSVIIPSSVKTIYVGAFSDCTSLTSITIPNTVTRIDDWVFDNCDNLKIYGAANSYASQYATMNNIPFVVLDLLAPTGLTSPSKTKTTINLSWNAVTGATEYDVYNGPIKVNVTPITATTFVVTGLIQNTLYSFTVKAVNEAVVSAASLPLNISTSPNQITSNTYNIDLANGYISVINEKTSIAILKSNISNPSQQIKVFNVNQTENTIDFVGTGMTIRLYEGNNVIHTLTLVIKGDVSGDGIIGLCDLVSIRNCLLECNQLNGAYKSAGDLYGEEAITLNDLVGMMAYVSEEGTINQNKYVAFTNKKLTGQIITNIQPGSTVDSFLNGVILEKDSRLEFKNGETFISGTNKIRTGTVINVYVNEVKYTSYTMVIYGDVSGDGAISLNDLTMIRDHILDASLLDKEYKQAGDLYGEGEITLNDLVGLMAYISGGLYISQII